MPRLEGELYPYLPIYIPLNIPYIEKRHNGDTLMYCMFFYTARPPHSAKKSRLMWDALARVHGREPTQLGLYVSEGGFRDWHIEIGDLHIDFEDAIVGAPSTIDPIKAAKSTLKEKPKSWRDHNTVF